MLQVTEDLMLQAVRKEMSRKQTNGKRVLAELATVAKAIHTGSPLGLEAVMLQPEFAQRALHRHFKSSKALEQHAGAVMTAIKSWRPRAPGQTVGAWKEFMERAKEDSRLDSAKVQQLFQDLKGATPKTLQGYVNEVTHILAKLNVKNIEEVLADPWRFRLDLLEAAGTPGTESSHISKLLGIFERNPELKRRHQAAYEAWVRASSEHRARQDRDSKKNAPSNPSQAANYVPMAAWRPKLEELLAASDPHSTVEKSMAILFMAYACMIPPKRAEVGGIRVFETAPAEQEAAQWPNHVILSDSEMRITKHKTSKHEVHKGGIIEQLPPRFMELLRTSLALWPRTHMFIDGRGQPQNPQAFSKWVIRITGALFDGKSPGLSLLRHAFCTALDYNTLTGLEREEIAHRCGHTAQTQDRYRILNMTPISKKA